jgi:hypothetical protein
MGLPLDIQLLGCLFKCILTVAGRRLISPI